jgi:S1-C subfamily serine protease
MRKLSAYGPSLLVLATVIVVLKAGPSAVWQLTHTYNQARIVQAAEGLDRNPILQQLNQAYRDVAALVSPSVVHISTERIVRDRLGQVRPGGFAGSGWIWDEDGHIVTNYHVVERAERVEVQLSSGQSRPAKIVGFDPFTDIAVLKVAPGQLIAATRAEAGPGARFEGAQQGDLVFAFGSPFDFRFSMSSGVVSGTGRSVGVIRDEFERWLGYENFIQVDAAINRGNSGGPLTDTRGRVIGMNTAIATERGSRLDEGQFAGVGLAIPIDMIEPVVRQLIETGSVEKGFLGVAVLDQDDSVALELWRQGFRGDGLVLARVEPQTPASAAGLRLGDVVTQVAGKPVATLAQARAAAEGLPPDASVPLALWRYDAAADEGRLSVLDVPAGVARSFHGVELLALDDTLGDWLKVLGTEQHGVRIARVELDTPAHRAGLRPRDSVTRLDGDAIASAAQLRSKISSMMPGDVAHLRVWRFDEAHGQGAVLTVEVELDRLDTLRFAGTVPDGGPSALREVGIEKMSTSSPDLAAQHNVEHHPGVLVEAVVAGSALAERMEPGSIIVAVMDQPVTSREEFLEMLGNLDLRRGARVRFIRPDGGTGDALLRVR